MCLHFFNSAVIANSKLDYSAFILVSRKIERLVCEMLFTEELNPSLSIQADPTHAKLFVLTVIDISIGSIQLSIFLI